MKHIEQIQPEVAAYDLERIFREEGDATATAALTALLHNVTGCDIPQTDTTPESEVEELVPLCLSILRRHWTTPLTALGDGTTPMSLADLMRRLIGDRVQGNEAWCIPPVHDNIPAAVSALRERKISGVPELPDGLSFARIFCDSTIPPITELIDDNIGWVMDKRFAAKTYLKDCELVELNCVEIDCGINDYNGGTMLNSDCEYHLPSLKRITPQTANVGFGHGIFDCAVQTHDIYMPELERIEKGSNFAIIRGINAPNNTEPFSLYAPKLSSLGSESRIVRAYNACATGVEKIVLGTIETPLEFAHNTNMATPNLIHLEFGQGTSASLNLAGWNPTDKGSLFLSNFRLYIADRLSDNGSGKTLTLSQEVRDAIHSAGIDTIITNKGWTISPVPTQQ